MRKLIIFITFRKTWKSYIVYNLIIIAFYLFFFNANISAQVPIVIPDRFPLENDYKVKSDNVMEEFKRCQQACYQKMGANQKGASGTIDQYDKPMNDCGCKAAYDAQMSDLSRKYNNDYNLWRKEMEKKYTMPDGNISTVGAQPTDGQSVNYANAGDIYREFARKTVCPERAAYFNKMADWYDCWVKALAGLSSNCPDMPADEVPPCVGDQVNTNERDSSAGVNNYPSDEESSSEKLNQIINRNNQTQIELENAKTKSMNAYEDAISNGRKESGAMVDATLEGASALSDPTEALVYTGVGLGLALFKHLSENNDEVEEKEQAAKEEANHIQLIISTKNNFIKDALNINKYSFSDLISKDRYASLLLVPNTVTASEQDIYFTYPVLVPKYSDDTYPLKDDIQKQLLKLLDKTFIRDKLVYTLYPITNPDLFITEFINKMGSGKVIFWNAQILKTLNRAFATKNNVMLNQDDFWESQAITTIDNVKTNGNKKETDGSFWDH